MFDWLKGTLLSVPDKLNVWLSPFEDFTREPDIKDPSRLRKKAEYYCSDILKNWSYGPNKEFYWSMKRNDGGDMAIWQGCWAATLAFKLANKSSAASAQKATGKALAKALDGMELIQTLGKDNRLSRGVDGAIEALDGPRPVDMAYDPSRKYYGDRGYVYHQDCSESSLIGQVFGLWSIIYLKSSDELVRRAVKLTTDLADQIIKDGYRLLNQDGTPARHGDLRPLNWPWQLGTRKPVAVAATAALMSLAWKSSGKEKYKKEYEDLKKHMGQITHPEAHFLWIHPQYQDILAYMVLSVLCSCETDDETLQKYVCSLREQWKKNKEEGNSFYTYVVQLVTKDVEKRHLEKAEQILKEFNTTISIGPTAKTKGAVKAEGETFTWGWKWLRGGKDKLKKQPIPVWRRPPADIMWQRNPYSAEGHSDHDFNCMDFCLAFYLGKYTKAL